MVDKGCGETGNWPQVGVYSIFFLFLVLSIACGRKGDPVAIAPYPEKAVEQDLDTTDKVNDRPNIKVIEKDNTAEKKIRVKIPDSPTGLIAVYSQNSIILTWNEIRGQGVRFYRIYRSIGNDYVPLGDAVTPAFTDKGVKSNTKYYYKVTAVGVSESPLSEEIEVLTEVH
jgi:hypothetical protein